MGETISHETAKDELNGPIQVAARRLHHMLSKGGNKDSLLSDYITENGSWDTISSAQMRNSVRRSVKILNLHKNGIDPDLVGVHFPSRRSNGIEIARGK